MEQLLKPIHLACSDDCIEVSDDALEAMRYKFSGLPDKPHADTVIYRGEFAKFILENWE